MGRFEGCLPSLGGFLPFCLFTSYDLLYPWLRQAGWAFTRVLLLHWGILGCRDVQKIGIEGRALISAMCTGPLLGWHVIQAQQMDAIYL